MEKQLTEQEEKILKTYNDNANFHLFLDAVIDKQINKKNWVLFFELEKTDKTDLIFFKNLLEINGSDSLTSKKHQKEFLKKAVSFYLEYLEKEKTQIEKEKEVLKDQIITSITDKDIDIETLRLLVQQIKEGKENE